MIDVVIVSAGKGSRMQPYTFEKPKALVPINGKPLIQWQLDAFKDIEVENFVVVIGHLFDKMEDYLEDHKENIKLVYNEDYKDVECGHSMIKGLRQTKNDVICVVGDLLFTKKNLKVLIKNQNNCIFVRKPEPSMLGQKVRIKHNFVDEISLGGYNSYDAEAVGPFKLKANDVTTLIDNYSILEEDAKRNVHCYSLLGLFAEEYKLIPLYVDDSEWMEIDKHSDWKIANKFWRD